MLIAAACGRETRPPKVLVIGLDGATWDLVQPWIDEGRLPRLAALREEGAHGTLFSVLPCLSPPAWTSAVTGVNPGRHGIYDFYRLDPDSNVAYQETGRSRRVPALWTLLSEEGRRVGFVNVPMSDPPDPVDGFLVSGFPHPDTVDIAYPPELEARLHREGYLLDRIGEVLTDGEEAALRDEIVNTFRARRRITRALLEEHPDLDVAWMVFTGTDRVQHFFWKFMDPENPHFDAEKAKIFGSVIPDLYGEVDAAVGDLVDVARAQAAAVKRELAILVMSDHGFAPVRRVFRPQSFLRDPPGGLAPIPHTYSIDTNGAVLHVDAAAARRMTPEEYDAMTGEVVRRILAAEDPETGLKPALLGGTRRDLFRGRYVDKAPDIVFQPRAPYTFIHEAGDKEHFGTPEISFSGHHDLRGMLIAVGPMFRRGAVEGQASLMDMAPTVLYLAGLPVPGYMEGDVVSGWLTRERLDRLPVRRDDREAREQEGDAETFKAIPYIQ